MASQSLTTGNNASDLPLVPPPRSSSREPAPIIDASIAEDQPRESRRRDVSRGSKRSDRPQSSGVADTKAKRKKKGGFLSFLSCCSSETVDPDSSEPSKASASRSQPARSRVPPPPPPQQQQQTPQNISVTDTSGESNDVIDEKNEDTVTGAASTTAPEMSEKSLPSTHLQTTPIAPQVSVQAPTPVIAQSEEEQLISDRTPEQAQRDTDIEMTDAGPSIPLSTAEVPAPEDEPHESTRDSIPRVDLPPPPPLAERQAQTTNSVAAAHAQETSIAFSEPSRKWLLPPLQADLKGRKCLVLDLDETLVHSSFKILHQADFTIPVEIEGQYHNVYVIKRPGVDKFLKRVGEIYEVVVFTASVSKYGDPLLDQLDISGSVHHRLFRESCYNHQGNYVKDLSQVGRPLEETIIIDNSPTSYIFHPQHAVPISSWFSDAHDNELLDLIPVLEDLAGEQVRDVSLVLDVAL